MAARGIAERTCSDWPDLESSGVESHHANGRNLEDDRVIAPEYAPRWNQQRPASTGMIVTGAPPLRVVGRRGNRIQTERSPSISATSRASVLIANSEMLVRAGLRAVVDSDPAFQVIADAATGEHALELIARLQPALVIVSTNLEDPGGIEVARLAQEVAPETVIVLMTRSDDNRCILEGLRAGVTGFVRSDVGRLDFLTSLRRALAGESVIDPGTATDLIMRMAAESDLAPGSTPDALTRREVEILQLVAQGQTNRQIATRLIVAVGTIKVHVEHILGKLGAADRTHAAVRAVELGIVHSDEPERSVASSR
jgi:DNA-binding NarL/FixJ family response regulator